MESFKYEDLRTLLSILSSDDFLFKFDLKSGYHHVKPHWKYLGFSWDKGEKKAFYVFTVLPFGLATACYVFTKLLQPLTKFWGAQRLKAVIYLGDGIVASTGFEAATRASLVVRDSLQRSGLVANVQKSTWTPVQSLTC